MNWRFTEPGAVHFEKGEAICFVTLMPHAMLDAVVPRIRELGDDPVLKSEHDAWSKSRNDFNARLAANEPDAVKEGWQRTYVRGTFSGPANTPRRFTAPNESWSARAEPVVFAV